MSEADTPCLHMDECRSSGTSKRSLILPLVCVLIAFHKIKSVQGKLRQRSEAIFKSHLSIKHYLRGKHCVFIAAEPVKCMHAVEV